MSSESLLCFDRPNQNLKLKLLFTKITALKTINIFATIRNLPYVFVKEINLTLFEN